MSSCRATNAKEVDVQGQEAFEHTVFDYIWSASGVVAGLAPSMPSPTQLEMFLVKESLVGFIPPMCQFFRKGLFVFVPRAEL